MLQVTSPFLPRGYSTHASDMLIDRSAADDGAHDAAREPRFVERRVLALRFEIGGVEHPRRIGLDYDDVGRRAGTQRAARQAQQLGGARRQSPDPGLAKHLALFAKPRRPPRNALSAQRAPRLFRQ